MTGYAWFISQCLRPNPGIYLPLQGGTMTGDIVMDKNRLLKLPLPTDNQEAATKKYHDDNIYSDAEADARIALHAAIAAAHHARYTDGETDARIAIHAALATVHQDAPGLIAIHAAIAAAHHAAFILADHTAIGDNAPHHARYADAEADARIAIHAAIAAAHHAAFTAANHTAIGNGAPHHARYADAEAVTAAKTVKLDDFATPDDNADLNASAARHGLLKKLSNSAIEFLNGLGNWVEVVGEAATKEFFVPVMSGSLLTWYENFAVCLLAENNEVAFTNFRVPANFTSITEAEIILIARQTSAAFDLDISSNYAAEGQAYNTHSESDAASTYNMVDNNIYAIDLSGILTALAANDNVGIQLRTPSGYDVNVLGIHFKYA
jgi:hypothetical protein